MTRFKYLVKQSGRFVAEGVVEALADGDIAADRIAIQKVLSDRKWKGEGFSLKVGDAAISFDERDVEQLIGEVACAEVKDRGAQRQDVEKEALDLFDALGVPRDLYANVTPTEAAEKLAKRNLWYDKRAAKVIQADTSLHANFGTPCDKCAKPAVIGIDPLCPYGILHWTCGCGDNWECAVQGVEYSPDAEIRFKVSWALRLASIAIMEIIGEECTGG